MTGAAAQADRVTAAREVVYDDAGELIQVDELDAALEDAGVTVAVNEDGRTAYADVPDELPLSACHLAVDLRRDPAEFIAGERA